MRTRGVREVAARDVLLVRGVRVRITRSCGDVVDGVDLGAFHVGLVYTVSASLGSYLIANECAEVVLEDEVEPRKEDELQFRVNVDRWREVAADVIRRGRRREDP